MRTQLERFSAIFDRLPEGNYVTIEDEPLLKRSPEAEERRPSNVMVEWGCGERHKMTVDLFFEICQLVGVIELVSPRECKGVQITELT
jgi:hypothetical protein